MVVTATGSVAIVVKGSVAMLVKATGKKGNSCRRKCGNVGHSNR